MKEIQRRALINTFPKNGRKPRETPRKNIGSSIQTRWGWSVSLAGLLVPCAVAFFFVFFLRFFFSFSRVFFSPFFHLRHCAGFQTKLHREGGKLAILIFSHPIMSNASFERGSLTHKHVLFFTSFFLVMHDTSGKNVPPVSVVRHVVRRLH